MQFINITTTFNIIFQHVTMHTQHVQYAVQYWHRLVKNAECHHTSSVFIIILAFNSVHVYQLHQLCTRPQIGTVHATEKHQFTSKWKKSAQRDANTACAGCSKVRTPPARPPSQTHRQDRLQYTAPQIASAHCKYCYTTQRSYQFQFLSRYFVHIWEMSLRRFRQSKHSSPETSALQRKPHCDITVK